MSKRSSPKKGPRILLFDIETAPVLGYAWGLFDQNIGLNQIHTDWHVLSWAAKWLDTGKVMYMDQRKARPVQNDKALLKGIWELLDQADIVITQNGKKFDVKKLNARFVINGFKPTSSFKHIDTLAIARKYFGFTSNKLEYLSKALNARVKKLTRRKFDGFDLWKECLAGNKAAWNEMERYNKQDVLALEDVYKRLIPWDSSINFSIYSNDDEGHVCSCGSTDLQKYGYAYTASGKYQRYRCNNCGKESRSAVNLFTKEKRESLKRRVS